MIKRKVRRAGRRLWKIMFALSLAWICAGVGVGRAEEKITIGGVEEVLLLPWGVRLLARVDTGAATSSLGARELKINNNMAEFRLREEYGGRRMTLPIVEWRGYNSSGGHELRPVVILEICLGPRRLRTSINLNDRSQVTYPFLIGRRILKQGGFVVDVSREARIPPSCPGVQAK